MKQTPHTLVFDLDGTLVDTAPDLTASMNAVLAELGRPPVDAALVRNMVGRGARVLIERGLAATGAPARSAAELDTDMALFLDHYRANLSRRSRAFPGVVETLERFAARGHKMGVCTNKPEALSLALLDDLDLRRFFPAVLGADSRPYRKPDGRHVLDTVAALGGDPARTLMIGDSETDVGAARSAGVPVIVLSYGYTALAPETLGGDRLLDHFADLPAAIAAFER